MMTSGCRRYQCRVCGFTHEQRPLTSGVYSPCQKCGGRMQPVDTRQKKRDAKAKAELKEQEALGNGDTPTPLTNRTVAALLDARQNVK